jgi:pyrroline-5-carboxylate reductase
VASSAGVWPKSLALVGAGKMGGAMLRGWLAGGLAPGVVAILDPAPAPDIVALAAARGLALTPPSGMKPEVLILAVKPQMLDTAATAIAALAHEDALVISIIAGKTIANLKARAPKARAFVRAMPNTPAAIGRGVTGAAANDALSERQKDMARTLLSTVGIFDWLPDESFIDAVTALSGSGPAYVFALVEAMAAAGEALGLPSDLAMRFARGTVEGAGELLAHEPETPAAQLRQNVTSPAGTTAAALKVLQSSDGLGRLMREAIAAAHKRAGELAG